MSCLAYLWDREEDSEVGGNLEIYPVSDETKADCSLRLPSFLQTCKALE